MDDYAPSLHHVELFSWRLRLIGAILVAPCMVWDAGYSPSCFLQGGNMRIRGSICFALTFAFALPCAQAQTPKWPEKTVRLVVATAPGGGDDFVTRLLAPKLSELLNQQFIVDNRAGAGGMIGQTHVMKSPPDGYTWLLAGGSMAGARYVNAAVTYDVMRDFTPVSLSKSRLSSWWYTPQCPRARRRTMWRSRDRSRER
jgi:hypothetical protein